MPIGIGGALDVVLVRTLENIRDERAKVFFDELAKDNHNLDESLLESEDFLHCYFATAKYALNSRRREKIQMFARLLKASITDGGLKDVDDYEHFLGILDELNYREIQALVILDQYSDRPREKDQSDLEWTEKFWGEFVYRIEKELKIPNEEVTDFLNRISRTGCYGLFVGGWYGYFGGKGQLTPTYHRLKQYILERSETS